MEYGILEFKRGNTGDNWTYNMAYPFGKADEIKKENDEVMLYKYKYGRVLKGIFQSKQFDYATFDPKYTQLDSKRSYTSYPIIPYSVHFSSNYWKDEAKYIEYTTIKNKKEVKGIFAKNIKADGPIWIKLVPYECSECNIDTTANLIYLTQIKNKRKLKGLVGFTAYWRFHITGRLISGNCMYCPEFTIPCEYDDIELLCSKRSIQEKRIKFKFFRVKKDGKYGLLKVCYMISRGPCDNYYTYYGDLPHNIAAKVEVLLECTHDRISCESDKTEYLYRNGIIFIADDIHNEDSVVQRTKINPDGVYLGSETFENQSKKKVLQLK